MRLSPRYGNGHKQDCREGSAPAVSTGRGALFHKRMLTRKRCLAELTAVTDRSFTRKFTSHWNSTWFDWRFDILIWPFDFYDYLSTPFQGTWFYAC
jgi:hypothetical protein